jgi:hypothetical protein
MDHWQGHYHPMIVVFDAGIGDVAHCSFQSGDAFSTARVYQHPDVLVIQQKSVIDARVVYEIPRTMDEKMAAKKAMIAGDRQY